MACKLLPFFDVGGASHIDDVLTFIWIGFNSSLCQHVSKEFPDLNPERALSGIQ